jgi:hypothetical protein
MARMRSLPPYPLNAHRLNSLRLLILCAVLGSCVRATLAQPFVNVSQQQGMAAMGYLNFGASVSFHDFDHDGWDDVLVSNPDGGVRLFRNQQGQLALFPGPAVTGPVRTSLWADLDNDGFDDLLVLRFNSNLSLYRNNGGMGFTDVTVQAGLPTWSAPHFGASFGDYDRDGHLDLYVCNWVPELVGDYTNLNHLYRNNGDGTFTDVTLAAGVGDGHRGSLQSLWFDHDMDGWPDLYVITDRFPLNALYRNNGDGTFTDIAEETNSTCPDTDSMSAGLGDLENNGLLDIYVTNNGTDLNPLQACRLLVRQADGTYQDLAEEYALACTYPGWGAVWVDMDNDTRQDLFVGAQEMLGARLHRNLYPAPFQDLSNNLGNNPPTNTYAVAYGDLDNDGKPDLLAGADAPSTTTLWRNANTNGNHWVKVTPRGTASNRMAVGTWIRVYTGGLCQVRYTTCGYNYLSQDSPHIHFGLGAATVIDSISVTYPSGHVDTYHGLAVDTHYWATEGETYAVTIAAQGPVSFCPGGSVVLDAGEHHQYLWNTGADTRFLLVDQPGAYAVTITTVHGVQVTSQAVEVALLPAPQVLPSVVQPGCAGESTGSIGLSNSSGVPIATVDWNTGATGAQLNDLPGGTYVYMLTDANGCMATGSIGLVDPPELFALVEATGSGPANDGSITIVAFGGTPPYAYSLNGTSAAPVNNDLPPGAYLVVVTDANGCAFQVEAFVSGSSGIAHTGEPYVVLHPNPAGDLVFLRTGTPVERAELLDQRGACVRSWTAPLPHGLPLNDLAQGTYLLRTYASDGHPWMVRLVRAE